MTAVLEKSDLNGRLAEAQRAEDPLRQRVNELEADLSGALAKSDYLAADKAKNALGPARSELAIALAQTTALQAAVAEVQRQQQESQRAIQEQRQRDQARALLEKSQQREKDAHDEVEQHLADAQAGILAVQQSLQAATQADQVASQARQDVYQALVTLGDQPPGAIIAGCYNAHAAIERDPVLRSIYHYRGRP